MVRPLKPELTRAGVIYDGKTGRITTRGIYIADWQVAIPEKRDKFASFGKIEIIPGTEATDLHVLARLSGVNAEAAAAQERVGESNPRFRSGLRGLLRDFATTFLHDEPVHPSQQKAVEAQRMQLMKRCVAELSPATKNRLVTEITKINELYGETAPAFQADEQIRLIHEALKEELEVRLRALRGANRKAIDESRADMKKTSEVVRHYLRMYFAENELSQTQMFDDMISFSVQHGRRQEREALADIVHLIGSCMYEPPGTLAHRERGNSAGYELTQALQLFNTAARGRPTGAGSRE